MQGKLSTLIGQLIKETMDKKTLFVPPYVFLLSEFDCNSFPQCKMIYQVHDLEHSKTQSSKTIDFQQFKATKQN